MNLEANNDIHNDYSREVKFDPANILLLKSIYIKIENYISTNLKNAFNKKILHEDEIEWPCLVMIREFFDEYVITEEISKIQYVDVFNYNFELKFNLREPSKLPNLIKTDKLMSVLKKWGIKYESHDYLRTTGKSLIVHDENDSIDAIVSQYKNKKKIIADSSWTF